MQIEKLLFEHIATLTALPIAYPGVPFDKPADNKYVELIHLPNDPINYDWRDDATAERGLLQINVHWTRHVGIVAPNDHARVIATQCSKNTVIGGSLMIATSPTIGQWIDDFIPIRVSYRSV